MEQPSQPSSAAYARKREIGQNQVLIMSRQGDHEDERRLYHCARKYEKIVKQFDELIEMMDTRTRAPKRRRVSSSRRGSSNASFTVPESSNQPDSNEALVQTIAKFLHQLREEPAADDADNSESSTRDSD